MRALVVSNMEPGPGAPGRGIFVRDQVRALRALGAEVELYEFGGGPVALAGATVALRRRFGRRGAPGAPDVVHAHFGLSAWPALAVPARARVVTLHGTDLRHPRTRAVAQPALRRLDLIATASEDLATDLPDALRRRPHAVLPCGVDLERNRPMDRARARERLGLDPARAMALFPADPARGVKRHDRARAVTDGLDPPVELRSAGAIAPEEMALWINAADAVLVPSEREGFGLAVLEALACGVPVLATPVGVHASALEGLEHCLCTEFDARRWRAALSAIVRAGGPRVDGRPRARRWSSEAMAARVVEAWSALLGD